MLHIKALSGSTIDALFDRTLTIAAAKAEVEAQTTGILLAQQQLRKLFSSLENPLSRSTFLYLSKIQHLA